MNRSSKHGRPRPDRASACFIRADLNVPQDDDGTITDDTRIRASLPGIRMALDKGAAVMVTSHLGRPEGRRVHPRPTRSRPVAKRLSASCSGRDVPLVRDWLDGVDGRARPGGAARELPLQQGREEERRGARAQDGGALRRLRERRLRHRAPRGGHHPRRREVRAGRLRRAAARRRARGAGPRARQARSARWWRSSPAPRSPPSSPS